MSGGVEDRPLPHPDGVRKLFSWTRPSSCPCHPSAFHALSAGPGPLLILPAMQFSMTTGRW